MNWSTTIQGIETLDRSRELRFRDDHADLLLRVLDIRSARTIGEIGCGPGALSRALARWLGPGVRIAAIDLDRRFVGHAAATASEASLESVEVLQGDALSLPLRSDSLDVCLSYTVIEHLPHESFLREQRRVCRRGGRVITMMALPEKSLASIPDGWPPMTANERELWEHIRAAFQPKEAARGVGAHWPDPAGLPKTFEQIGLTSVRVDALALPVVPDDARLTAKQQIEIIEADRAITLERIDMAETILGGARAPELSKLRELVEVRFGKRLHTAESGEHVWDYTVSFVLVVSGQR